MNLPPIKREEIPFGIAGKGALNVSATIDNPLAPLPPASAKLLDVRFDVDGSTPLTFGSAGKAKLTVDIGSKVKLGAIFPNSAAAGDLALLAGHGLQEYFATHPGNLLMTLQLGASADAGINPTIRYQALSVQGSVNVGADGGYILIKPYPANTAAGEMVTSFLKSIRMPASIDGPLATGEVISYEYGGYLRLGASVSLGYQIQGAPSFQLGDLQLSEKYSAALMGTVGVQASMAGRFEVEVRGIGAPAGMPADKPGKWVQVTVRRKRSRQFSVAGDVTLRANSQLNGLPESSDEFLGALLGVNGQSWLNYLETFESRVQQLADVDKLGDAADGLARQFLGKLIGKSFDQLGPQLNLVLPKVREIVQAYQKAGDRATALFDRFFDRIETDLVDRLNQVKGAASWDALFGKIVDPDLARVVETLTGADPVQLASGFTGAPEKALDALKQSAEKVLNLIQDKTHEKIVEVVTLAKQQFGLDPLFAQLASIDSEAELRAKANDLAGGFASRLIGKAVTELKKSELDEALARIKDVVAKRKLFQDRIFAKFREMSEQSFKLSLHAEYSRSSESEALLSVQLNLEEEKGRQLLAPCAEGDFSAITEAYRPPEHRSDPDPAAGFRPNAVRILEGTLTHRTRRETAFKVNVIGWHRNWIYQGFDRVIVDTEQQIKADASGSLTVHTTLELQKEKERRSGLKGSEERMYTNFVLRFLGESSGALQFDKSNQQFLLDVIRSMSARYELNFQDEKTTAEELRYYLSFAREFGLAESGVTFESISRMLPSANRNFGAVDAAYEVVFNEEGLKSAFVQQAPGDRIRSIMRSIVFANYVRESAPFLAEIGWCYFTPGIYLLFKETGTGFNAASPLSFRPIAVPEGAALFDAPEQITLRPEQLAILSTLYRIEDRFVSALLQLQKLLARPAGSRPMKVSEYEKALQDFGGALKSFDSFDEGVNTVFAVLDQLIRAAGGDTLRGSMLRLKSEADGRKVEKLFLKAAPGAMVATGALGQSQ